MLTPQSLPTSSRTTPRWSSEGPEDRQEETRQIFPRYHQLDVVRKLLADAEAHGVASVPDPALRRERQIEFHRLARASIDSARKRASQVFDSVIVVTDRRILDQQIRDTIKQFAQVARPSAMPNIPGPAQFIEERQEDHHLDRSEISIHSGRDRQRTSRPAFAIIIDEAHSSQGGIHCGDEHGAVRPERKKMTKRSRTRSTDHGGRKMLPNASYFAFTATPKNKTLEIFGEPYNEGDQMKHRPFHSYTMKQAIEEGFILDVLKYYTPVDSYYHLIKTVEDDPEFDTKRAKKKLRRYVERHEHAIRLKAEIMVDHFHEQVIALTRSAAKRARWSSPAGSSVRSNIFMRSAISRRAEEPVQGDRRLFR